MDRDMQKNRKKPRLGGVFRCVGPFNGRETQLRQSEPTSRSGAALSLLEINLAQKIFFGKQKRPDVYKIRRLLFWGLRSMLSEKLGGISDSMLG